jgi:predicted glycoside hydrolase/deacetylase ChbG (UPF0249 family)
MTARTFALCADDFGMSAGINAGILDLAARGRLSAVSCMTGCGAWREGAAKLAALHDRVDIGLHLTLVDEAPLTAMPRFAPGGKMPGIGALIGRSYLTALPRDEIHNEIAAQFDAFSSVMGFPPDHVDSHQHAHVLPGIRELVLSLAHAHAPKAWLRNTTEPLARIAARPHARTKAAVISVLGRAVAATPHAGNDGFSGLSDFDSTSDYGALFALFVADIGPRHLVLCHPAASGQASRVNEYHFLGSDDFPALLRRLELSLFRLSAA